MDVMGMGAKIISRRHFLSLVGAGVAGCTFIKLPFGKLLQINNPPPEWKSYQEKEIPTVCQLCPGACGLNVRTIDGFPVSVSGNSLHPINQGRLCPKGLSALQSYYHPARIDGPQIKRNGQFVSISWDEAIGIVAKEMANLRKNATPQEFCFLHSGLTGVSKHIARKFATVFGTPNFIGLDGSEGINLANQYSFGSYQRYAYDIENSHVILSFGARLLEAWDSPLYGQRAIATMREPGKDTRLIQIEPRYSTTAARADEWVPIRPGTEGALALGIAYVLIKENLYDSEFVNKHCSGFEQVRAADGTTQPGFKQFVIENYHPYKVSKITGVPSAKIISFAKLLASTKPAVALIDQPLTQYTNGVQNAMAVNALNALIGTIDRPGGVLKQRKMLKSPFEDLTMDEIARQGLASERIDGTVVNDATNEHCGFHSTFNFKDVNSNIKLLFVYNSNPSYDTPLPETFHRWMTKIPLTVNFSNTWNETAEASTLILPEHHFLDRWQDVPASDVFPYTVMGLSQPVSNKPLQDTKHFIDILTSISSATAGPLKDQLSLSSAKKIVKDHFSSIYVARRGIVFSDKFNTAQVKMLEERGWWSDSYESSSKFWKELKAKGGWWDPAYTFGEWSRVISTPSRKYEFFSQELDARQGKIPDSARKTVFPHYQENVFGSDAKNYPLFLNVYEPISFSRGIGGDIPWLLENPTAPVDTFWETWAEMNPETAAALHLADGDNIIVESSHGKIEAVVKYHAAAQPDIVSMPIGLGRKSFSTDIPSAGSNVFDIVSPQRETLSGTPAILSTMVKVYRL